MPKNYFYLAIIAPPPPE